ncbi:MAG: hypothetical protein HYX79_02290 [Chloroflexi bacterium]|nr:hypothetical protein [Chloroflexota bacterium]
MNTQPKKENGKKSGFGKKFLHFLMYGGWMLLLVVIVGIVIAASTCLSK